MATPTQVPRKVEVQLDTGLRRDAVESAFDAWAASTEGRPCDYTGLSHARLRTAPSGIQWPCNAGRPDGTERLYVDGRFWSAPDYCESYGRDMVTGAPLSPTEYRALNPDARAVLKAAEYPLRTSRPAPSTPSS